MDDDVEEYNSNYKPYTFKTVRCFTVLRINDNASTLVKACEFMGQFFGDFATNGKNTVELCIFASSIRSTLLVSGEDGQQWLHRDASPNSLRVLQFPTKT
jgi:hypothetical protein